MKVSFVVLAVALSGCSYLAPAIQKGSDAYDDVRLGAEFTLCRAISVGAWVRAYGASKEKADAWKALCRMDATELPSNN